MAKFWSKRLRQRNRIDNFTDNRKKIFLFSCWRETSTTHKRYLYICLLKGTNLTTFSSFPYNVCRSPRRVNNAISLLSPRILCEGNGNLSSWSFSNIYLSSGLRNIRGPWHSRWQDYMVGEEQWVILRMGTNIRRIPKRYTIWPWKVWVIHYVSVFQSDSSPQLWYRWEVSCESWKYYNINMIYICVRYGYHHCVFSGLFLSPSRFIWYSDLIRVFTGSHWWSIG